MSGISPEPQRDDDLLAIEFLLGEGSPAQLERYRGRMAADPLRALEIAETRNLLEQLHELRVTPSDTLQGRLDGLVRRCARRQERRRPTPTPLALLFSPRQWTPRIALQVAGVAAAAVLLFTALVAADPLGVRGRPNVAPLHVAAAEPPARLPLLPVVREPADIVQLTWDAVERLSSTDSRLAAAWERYQRTQALRGNDAGARLDGWLSAQNQLATLRWDYEMRGSSAMRLATLRTRGQLPAVEDRVQGLADELAAALLSPSELPAVAVAVSVRALLAAGGSHDGALRRGGERLLQALPELRGGELAAALAALGEFAVATGAHGDDVRRHAERLLREVVSVDDETWTRRRPRLLAASTPAEMLADAGRFLAYASAFGVDADQALFVRLLLAAHLQERRDGREEVPETLTALAYGFGDVLSEAEYQDVSERLRTWSPVSLVPDYASLHHLVWSRTPATFGYARFQLALRRIFAQPTPDDLADRAWLCLCLAANFRSYELGV